MVPIRTGDMKEFGKKNCAQCLPFVKQNGWMDRQQPARQTSLITQINMLLIWKKKTKVQCMRQWIKYICKLCSLFEKYNNQYQSTIHSSQKWNFYTRPNPKERQKQESSKHPKVCLVQNAIFNYHSAYQKGWGPWMIWCSHRFHWNKPVL